MRVTQSSCRTTGKCGAYFLPDSPVLKHSQPFSRKHDWRKSIQETYSYSNLTDQETGLQKKEASLKGTSSSLKPKSVLRIYQQDKKYKMRQRQEKHKQWISMLNANPQKKTTQTNRENAHPYLFQDNQGRKSGMGQVTRYVHPHSHRHTMLIPRALIVYTQAGMV